MSALFKYVPWDTQQLVIAIRTGTVTLPDLQRPFVWSATKVRDLFDSMYRGYPVGQLMFWQTGAEAGARQIGVEVKSQVATHAIVDGQQRLTSLYAVMTGEPVMRENYQPSRIKIAFNPFSERFEVAGPGTSSGEWIADITPLFQDPVAAVEQFVTHAKTVKNLGDDDLLGLRRVLGRLAALDKYQFTVVELDKEADEEQVAEIFVRINSEGISLNQADFILTLMSVFWEGGRRALEDFARSARVLPTSGHATAFNWHIQPKPEELLRVVVAVGLNRGRLRNAYSALRGRDIVTGKIDISKRQEQFDLLVKAQDDVLNLLHWKEFLKALERAGYRSEKQISSKNAVIYSYSLWLIGRTQFGVSVADLKELIARWFFMVTLTARYSGSFESTVEQDLSRIDELTDRTPQAFIKHLSSVIDTTFTNDFWSISLPAELETSASRSPALFAYIASLNVLDADALLSSSSVRSWLDPAVLAVKGIERHHLFPKKYLSNELQVTNPRQINQIANYALVEWSDNIAISDKAPTEYWESEIAKKPAVLKDNRISRQLYWHAIPESWPNISYDEFLSARRKLIAQVIRDAYSLLLDDDYEPQYSEPDLPIETQEETPLHYGVSLKDLVGEGILLPGTILYPRSQNIDVSAEISIDGLIIISGEAYETPSAAAAAVGAQVNGWNFWIADTPDGELSLNALRKLAAQDGF
jgi:hypothetical protein